MRKWGSLTKMIRSLSFLIRYFSFYIFYLFHQSHLPQVISQMTGAVEKYI